MQKHQIFFDKGIDKDTSYTQYDNHHYLHAENLRIISEGESSAMSLENSLGTTEAFNLNTNINEYDWVSVGKCIVSDYLIVFAHSVSLNTDRIYKITFNGYTSTVVIKFQGSLGFNSTTKLTAIGRLESNTIHKIYWSGVDINIMSANVYDDISSYAIDDFKIIPDNIFKPILLTSVLSGGNLKAGMVQYSYQLYNLNGKETPFSPPSDLIHITESNDSDTSYLMYGSVPNLNCNKSVKCKISNLDSEFDRIRIVSIHYDNIEGTPNINILGEFKNSSSIEFTDNGSTYFGSYTLEEFIFITQDFKCKTLETKNDYLFAANVDYQEFDFDYDARAYRFHSQYNGSGASYIYGTYNGSAVRIILSKVSNKATQGQTASGSTNATFTAYLSTLGNISNSWVVPEDFDCINPYNDLSKDRIGSTSTPGENKTIGTAFKCRANSTVLGAEGNNVVITFTQTQRMIDGSTPNTQNPFGTQVQGNNLYKYTQKSFARDEVYRLFLVGYDSKGRPSPAKWITDLRIPSAMMDGNAYAPVIQNVSGQVFANILGVRVDLANIPETVKGAQVFYVKREDSDKSIISRGILSRAIKYDGTRGAMAGYPANIGATTFAGNKQFYSSLYNFVSPEISFNKGIFTTPEYIEYSGEYKLKGQEITTEGTRSKYFHKIGGITAPPPSPYTKYSNITSYKIIGEAREREHFYIGTEPLLYTNRGETASTGTPHGYACTNMVAQLSSPFSTNTTLADIKHVYASLRKNVFASQYGGNMYKSRLRNASIPCSTIADASYGSTAISCYGDTFIGYFSFLYCYQDRYGANGTDEQAYKFETKLMLPIESDINPYLRTDKINEWYAPMSRDYALTESAQLGVTMWTGTNGNTGVVMYPEDVTDLYQYNKAYSKQNDTITAYPTQEDTVSNTTYNTRILYSDKKTNGEVTDSWSKFRALNFLDTDSQYGGINKLFLFKNQMFFMQDKSFGSLSIERQSTINDSNAITTVLGTGGILDRYDYFSTVSGSTMPDSIVVANNTFYWYDNYSRNINMFSQENESISKVKGLYSYLNGLSSINNFVSIFDKKNEELYFTTISDNGFNYENLTGEIISNYAGTLNIRVNSDLSMYDMIRGQMLGIYNRASVRINGVSRYDDDTYDIYTTIVFPAVPGDYPSSGNIQIAIENKSYIDSRNTLIYSTLTNQFVSEIGIPASSYIQLNDKIYSSSNMMRWFAHNYGIRCKFYTNYLPSESKVHFIVNPNNQYINRFDIVEWLSDCKNGTTPTSDTISSIRLLNSYQDTGEIDLINQNNLKQRFRLYRFNSIRNSTDSVQLKDAHSIIEMSFNNKNGYKFNLRELFVHYMPIMKL